MRIILLFLGIIFLLVAVLFLVNLTGIMPISEYLKDRCTRYCHHSHCPHFEAKVEAKHSLALKIQPAYQNAIYALKHNSLNLSYAMINLLVFVIGFPVLILSLSFNLLRKWKK